MKFIVDGMLKSLGRWLRFLGYDVKILDHFDMMPGDSEKETIFVTRSPKHFSLWKGEKILFSSDDLQDQLNELNEKYQIYLKMRPFSRCADCNAPLQEITPELARQYVPIRVAESFQYFYQCPECKKIYWEGGHVKRMVEKMKRLKIPIQNH